MELSDRKADRRPDQPQMTRLFKMPTFACTHTHTHMHTCTLTHSLTHSLTHAHTILGTMTFVRVKLLRADTTVI